MSITAFINLYARGVGGCIGFVYPTKQEAEAAASPSRVCLKEVQLHPGDSGPEDMKLIIPSDLWRVLDSFARAHKIEADTAAKEAIRAYIGDAA